MFLLPSQYLKKRHSSNKRSIGIPNGELRYHRFWWALIPADMLSQVFEVDDILRVLQAISRRSGEKSITEQKKGVCDRLSVSPTCRYIIILGAPRNGEMIGVYNPIKILGN